MSVTLILASASPRRRELIRQLGLPVEFVASHADESVPPHLAPADIVETLSLRKASAVCVHPGAAGQRGIVVGSDTIVVLDGEVLGKPRDEKEAFAMLASLRGRTHRVYTGLACIRRDGENGGTAGKAEGRFATMPMGDIGRYRVISGAPDGEPEIIVGHTVSEVTFGPMSDEEIRAYVESGEPMDKAGAYGVQGIGAVFIEKIKGDYFSIMGLPLNLLYRMLKEFGVHPFRPA